MRRVKDPHFRPLGIHLWAQPLPEEPAHGLFLRLAEINHYPNVGWIERHTGLSISNLRHGQKFDQLASIVHNTPDIIARDSFSDCDKTHITIRGEKIGYQKHYDVTRRRVCPACLRDSVHHRFLWDLNFLTSCPKHGLKLIDRCACDIGRPLSWNDGRLYRGRCCTTGDIRLMPGQAASDPVRAMDTYFAGRLGSVKRNSVPPLDQLSICDAIELLDRVGALKLGGYSKQWQSSGKLGLPPEEVRAVAFEIISEDRLQDILDATYKDFLKSEPKIRPSLRNAYGWFYQWYKNKGNDHSSPYLATEFMRHGNNKFHIRQRLSNSRPAIGRAISTPLGYKTLSDLMTACRTDRSYMKKILECYNLIDPTNNTGVILVADSDANVLMTLHKHLISKKTAARLLGFDNKTGINIIDCFVDKGLLTPFLTTTVSYKQNFLLIHKDILRLYTVIMSRCFHDQPDNNAVALSDPHKRISAANICLALFLGEIKRAWVDRSESRLRSVLVAKSELKGLRKKLDASHSLSINTSISNPADFSYWRERARKLLV